MTARCSTVRGPLGDGRWGGSITRDDAQPPAAQDATLPRRPCLRTLRCALASEAVEEARGPAAAAGAARATAIAVGMEKERLRRPERASGATRADPGRVAVEGACLDGCEELCRSAGQGQHLMNLGLEAGSGAGLQGSSRGSNPENIARSSPTLANNQAAAAALPSARQGRPSRYPEVSHNTVCKACK